MKVSVLICTYGSRDWSIRGSKLAKKIEGAHEVIALHENDGTLAGVRNLAATAASGDWLCFVDADDSLDTGYLEAMREAYERSGKEHQAWLVTNLLVPSVCFVGPDGCTPPEIPAWDRSIYDLNCAVIGTLVPRLLFARVGGFEDEWNAYEDWELWLRCIIAGARLVPVPAAVYCARSEDGTGRNTNAARLAEYNRIRTRHAGVPPDVWKAAKR